MVEVTIGERARTSFTHLDGLPRFGGARVVQRKTTPPGQSRPVLHALSERTSIFTLIRDGKLEREGDILEEVATNNADINTARLADVARRTDRSNPCPSTLFSINPAS